MAKKPPHPGRLRRWLESGDEGYGSAEALAAYLTVEAQWLNEEYWDCGGEAGERLFELHLVLWTLAEAVAKNGDSPMRLRLDLKRRGGTAKGGPGAPTPEMEMLFALAVGRARRHMATMLQPDAIERAMKEMRDEGRLRRESKTRFTHNAVKTRLRHSLKRRPLRIHR